MTPETRSHLRIVLIDTRNPLNIGAVARAMSNFGFFDLRLVNPYDLAFREAVSAVGAASLLKDARVFTSVGEAVADCSLVVGATGLAHRQPQHPLHRLERASRLFRRHLAAAPAALLFGSEKYGLSNDDVTHCHWLLRIPTRPEHESMNLAQAVAVCLYELIREPSTARNLPAAAKRASAAEVDRVIDVLRQMLVESGYTNPLTVASTEEKVRRLMHRLEFHEQDGDVLTGMFRQVLWKLKNSR